ncbi:MAG: hypothetical protein K6G50_10855 [bacterium]|nr:hypothetical protein [bacterium]
MVDMKQNDDMLIESVRNGDEEALWQLIDGMERGDDRSRKVLAELLKMSDKNTESALVKLFHEGDSEVSIFLCQTFCVYAESLFRMKLPEAPDSEIDELLCDYFSDVLDGGSLYSGSSLKSQIYAAVSARCEAYRKERGLQSFASASSVSSITPAEGGFTKDMATPGKLPYKMIKALEKLASKDREAYAMLVLHYLHGYNYSRLCQEFNTSSTATICSRMLEGMRFLAEACRHESAGR